MRDPLSLDFVNYALPIPRDAATLTALGLLFDRVIFPGVYIPTSDHDEEGYEKELVRLRALVLNESSRDRPSDTSRSTGDHCCSRLLHGSPGS